MARETKGWWHIDPRPAPNFCGIAAQFRWMFTCACLVPFETTFLQGVGIPQDRTGG